MLTFAALTLPDSALIAIAGGIASILAWVVRELSRVSSSVDRVYDNMRQLTSSIDRIQQAQIEQDKLINDLRIKITALSVRFGYVEPQSHATPHHHHYPGGLESDL
jgi:uncharacterized protein YoxC